MKPETDCRRSYRDLARRSSSSRRLGGSSQVATRATLIAHRAYRPQVRPKGTVPLAHVLPRLRARCALAAVASDEDPQPDAGTPSGPQAARRVVAVGGWRAPSGRDRRVRRRAAAHERGLRHCAVWELTRGTWASASRQPERSSRSSHDANNGVDAEGGRRQEPKRKWKAAACDPNARTTAGPAGVG